jgi:hypothetical protein
MVVRGMANGPGGHFRGTTPTCSSASQKSPRCTSERNLYEVHLDRPLRHSVESHREVGVLINLILRPDQPDPGDPES